MSDHVNMKIEWDPEIHRRLKLAAADQCTSMKALVQEAVRIMLDGDAAPSEPAPMPRRKEAPWFTRDVTAFVAATCELSPEWTVPSSDLRRACARHLGVPVDSVAPVAFGLALAAAHPDVRTRRVRQNGRLVYVYQGIRLRPTDGQAEAK